MRVSKVTKAWRYPEASERQLSRYLDDAVKQLADRAKQSVKRLKFDATDADIQEEESDLSSLALLLLAALIPRIRPIGLTIYTFNAQQWVGVAKSAGGGSVPAVQLLDQIGPTQSETWFAEKRAQWESQTQIAFRKLMDNIIDEWSARVRDLNLKDRQAKEVRDAIDERSQVWRSWGANRARGVVSTWNSILMRQRLKDANVTEYIWRGQLDERERLKHLLWEGKIIGLETSHVFPGEEYGCRCWAQPHFKQEQK